MMFAIQLADEAIDDLSALQAHERRWITDEIEKHLLHEPHVRSRNRKQLRPNLYFTWELRRHPFRIFYEVDLENRSLLIRRVGSKEGNQLYIRGHLINLDTYEDDNP